MAFTSKATKTEATTREARVTAYFKDEPRIGDVADILRALERFHARAYAMNLYAAVTWRRYEAPQSHFVFSAVDLPSGVVRSLERRMGRRISPVIVRASF